MEALPYRIKAEAGRKLVTISFDSVFWETPVAANFKTDCVNAVMSLRCPPGQHLVLVDLRNAVLQSKEVYEKMQALIGTATAKRIALVASSPLARMQTKRLQIRDNIIMFADMPEAEAWLFDRDRQAA